MFFFKYLLSFAKSNQQGMALALVTILVAVMTLSSLSIFYLSSAFNQGSFKSIARQQTQFAAEAGLQKGLRWLETTATISGHWSMNNHFNDPIQFKESPSLTEEEKKCLGSFGYHENFVHFVHHIPLEPMIEGEIDNYFNYVVIQKIAEEFQYLKTSGEETIHSKGKDILEEYGAPSWTAFTLELWIKSTNGEKTLFELSGDGNQIRLERLANNGLRATIGTGDSFQSDENIELAENEYQHVVLSWSKDEGASFYVDIDDSDDYANDSNSSIVKEDLPAITIPSGNGRMIVAKSADIDISGLRLWNTKRSNTQIFNNVRNFIKTNDNLIVSYYFDSEDELNGATVSKNPDQFICQGGRCGLVHASVEKSIQIIDFNEELNSTDDTLVDHYTRVPETSYFKIMSCGLGPLDTMVSMESIMKFEKFNDISAIKVGEKFL